MIIFLNVCGQDVLCKRIGFVLLGTLGSIDKEGEILNSLFSSSPAYDEEITGKNILMWKNKYYPATFLYLYKYLFY